MKRVAIFSFLCLYFRLDFFFRFSDCKLYPQILKICCLDWRLFEGIINQIECCFSFFRDIEKMSSPDEEKLGVKLHTRPFRDTISTVPIKKRRLFFHRSPSPPPKTQSPPSIDYETGDFPTNLTDKGSPDQSGFKILANGDISEAPKHHDLIRDGYNDREHIGNGLKDNFSDEKLVSYRGIEGSSKPDGRVDLAMEEENLDSKNISNETFAAEKLSGNAGLQYKETFGKLHIGNSVRREQLDLQDPCLGNREKLDVHDLKKTSVLSGSNTVSTQSCLHRSNWDLNMTMDTWEESSSDSAMKNHECGGNGEPGFSSLLGRNTMSAGSTREESNASRLKFSEPKSSSKDTFLSLHASPKPGPGAYNTETEAYLDLRLKPSFMPESDFSCKNIFNLGKVDSPKFLSLSMIPSSSTPETTKNVGKAVKPEPHGGIQERKTETFVLKPIKSESCETGESSRIKVSGHVNSPSVAAIKSEPVDDRELPQDRSMAKETRVSHLGSYDHNLIKSAKFADSNTKADSHMKDVLLQIPRECPKPLKCEVNSMVQVMQDADEGTKFISIKHASNEGSEHTDFFIKYRSEEGQNMNLLTESWGDDKPANLQEEPSTSGTLVENVADEKSEVVSRLSLSETDSKTEPGAETHLNSDVIECSQTDKELSSPMEECGNECDPGSSHAIEGVIGAVFEKGGFDGNGFEDGELRDEASLRANAGSHLIDDIEKSEDVCSRGLVNVSVAVSSSYEREKHLTVESPEMSKDPGTVECVNNIDPSVAADPQESSSVTGDSSRRETSRATRKIPRDSSRKDKISERKTKFDRDPTIVNIDKKGDGSVVENSGGHIESSFPLSNEAKRDAFDGGRSGRIINLNSASSRNMKRIHESPLSSRIEREKSAEKSFQKQKYRFGRSRDEDPSERYHKTDNEKHGGLAYGKRGSASVHMRVRGGPNSSHSRVRDERQPNPFCDRNFDVNYMRDRMHDHDDFRYSRPIPSAEFPMNSTSDVSIPRRISRKVSNELHHPTSEVNSDLGYVPQEKNRRTMPDEMLDRAQPLVQFDRTDRIPVHRERLSLSPRSRGMSPSQWSPHTTPEGFNGQANVVQCRSGASIVMPESMRSTRQQRLTEEMFARRQGSGYRSRLHEDMMEAGSSREHDFPRRDFSRKIQPRQATDEYYGPSFTCGQICELPADSESAVRRRCSEVRDPVRYRQRCIDDDEDFSFHVEEGPPRSYRYHEEADQGFNGGGSSSEGRFKNRLGNTSRRYRHIEEEQRLHEDGLRHQAEQGWNDSGFNNVRPRSRRY